MPARTYSLTLVAAVLSAAVLWAQDPELRQAFQGAMPDDEFGSAVAGLGDVDGDGQSDVVIGVPQDSTGGTLAGLARVYSGKTGTVLYTLVGPSANRRMGEGVGCAGDVDGDGVQDIGVGLPGQGGALATAPGRARVYSGATGSLVWEFVGDVIGDRFGLSIACAGDVDADGRDDVMVGAPGVFIGTRAGYVRIFSGMTGLPIRTLQGTNTLGDRFGFAIASAGDVDADGVNDQIVGSIGDAPNGAASGRAYVFSGATGATIWVFAGSATKNELGHGVAGLGDVNGDGHADVCASAFYGSGMGYARVYSGIDGSQLYQITGNVSGDGIGHSAGSVDVNGDGLLDLVLGYSGDDVGVLTNAGSVRVFDGPTGTPLGAYYGSSADGRLGYAVSGAGDVNGDGFGDFLAGTLVAGQPGYARIHSVGAAAPYGVLPPGGTQTLTLSWAMGPMGDRANGTVQMRGATPGGVGIVAFSVAPSLPFQMLGVDVFIDAFLPGGSLMFSFLIPGLGGLDMPVDLRNPNFQGIPLFLQTFEVNLSAPQSLYGSNALYVLFTG
ncbi:MAG: FG-GAP repeat protein [Planctomycetes bacterium]|nr:FG-GAP repeat protein [Planctomycetota bacterium]